MAVSKKLNDLAAGISGVEQRPYKAVAEALEVIPRTLVQNCGANVIRTLTKLRAKHAEPDGILWGIDGYTGMVADMKKLEIWDSFAVKVAAIKTAVEYSCMMLRIDDIISGINQPNRKGASS